MSLLARITKFLDRGETESLPTSCDLLSFEAEREFLEMGRLLQCGVEPPPLPPSGPQTVALIGPAGSGKTTLLADLVQELPDVDITFTSFSRAASQAFREKVEREYLGAEAIEPSTIYSLSHQVLSGIREEPVGYLGRKHRDDLKSIGINLDQVGDYDQTPGAGSPAGLAFDLLRHSRLTSGQICERVHNLSLTPTELDLKFNRYERFLEENDLHDHARLLQSLLSACEYFRGSPLVLVDEAQDLTSLEWRALDALTRKAEVVLLIGDPAQSIHSWRGCSVQDFMDRFDRADERRQLVRVFRHGPEISQYSERVVRRVRGIPNRIPVQTDAPKGRVLNVNGLESICHRIADEESGSWLILGRNRRFLRRAAEILNSAGIMFSSSGSLGLGIPEENESPAWMHWGSRNVYRPGPLGLAVEALVLLAWRADPNPPWRSRDFDANTRDVDAPDDPIPSESLEVLRDILPARVWATGEKPEQCYPEDFLLDALKTHVADQIEAGNGFRLLPIKTWRAKRLETWFRSESFKLMWELWRPGGPRVRLSTIHGSKGLEADRVAVMQDWDKRSRQAIEDPRSDEHRLGYVASTRARLDLFLCQPIRGRGYEFPRVRGRVVAGAVQ